MVKLVGSISPGTFIAAVRRAPGPGRRGRGCRSKRSAKASIAARNASQRRSTRVELVRAQPAAVGLPDLDRQLVAAGRVARLLDARARRAQRVGAPPRPPRPSPASASASPLSVVDGDAQAAQRRPRAGSPSGTGATPPSRAVRAGDRAAAGARRRRRSARAAPTCVRGSPSAPSWPLVVDHAGDRDAPRGRLERGEPAEVRRAAGRSRPSRCPARTASRPRR